MKATTAAAIFLVGSAPALAHAEDIVLPLTAWAQAESADGINFTITPSADPVFIRWAPSSPTLQEERSIWEFDLGAVPVGAEVQAATLRFDVSLFETQSGEPELFPLLTFWGYEGNGLAEVDDATVSTAPGDGVVSIEINALGSWTVNVPVLDLIRVQELVDSGASHFGLMGWADRADLTTGIWSETFGSHEAPTFTLTLVPEPASGVVLLLPLTLLMARRRSGATSASV